MRTAIIGLGVTGFSCVRYLHEFDELVVVDTRKAPPFLEEVRSRFPGIELRMGARNLDFTDVDRVIVSPGIALDSCLLRGGKTALLSDIDLFCAATSQPVFAITGTNGMSTV